MKKIIFISMFLLAFTLGKAQNVITTMTGSGDTLVNTTADGVVTNVLFNHKSVSVQAVVTKIGTYTIAGTALLQGSIDGVNYKDISTDTLTLANQTTNTKIWIVDDSPYYYFKVLFTGSGTMQAKIYGYLVANDLGQRGRVSNMTSTLGLNSDTVVNAATEYVSLRVQNWYVTTTIQAVVTKISGTVGGTVTLQGSNDGTNFVTVNTSYILGGSATLTALNQTTTSRMFVLTGSPYATYRLSYTGTGTMSASIKGFVLTNK